MILHPYRLTSEHDRWLSGDQALVAVLGDFATPTKRPHQSDPKTSCNLEGARLAVQPLSIWASSASEMFAGLPAGGLADAVYADMLPRYVLSELGGEALAGA